MIRKTLFTAFLALFLLSGMMGCGVNGATQTDSHLVGISITPTQLSIANNSVEQFTATGIYSDNTTRDLTSSVIWSSTDTTVATFDGATGSPSPAVAVGTATPGRAYAKAVGKTTITASLGGLSGSTTLTVTSATLVSVAITPTNPSIAKGTTLQFTATGTYSDLTTQDVTALSTWTSSNASVAAISNASGSSGLATSTAAGTTTIIATSGGFSASTTLTVTQATLLSLAVMPTTATIAQGANQQFAATGTYSDGTTQDFTAMATWSSSASAVASISNASGSKGLATAVTAGSATMTAMSGSVSGSAVLTVTAVPSATLTWDAPTTRTDGTALNPATDIFKYRIYYGTASASYSQTIDIMNPGTTSVQYTVNLPSGTYYFVVTTIDMFGQESSYSNEVSKTL